jgi:hypothetical protein
MIDPVAEKRSEINHEIEQSIMDMPLVQRQNWMIDVLVAQLEAQTKAFGEIRKQLPWAAAVIILASFIAGLCFAKWWWGIA